MRKQDNEFFVDLENGAIHLDERFKEVTGSKRPRSPYFEKVMTLDSGVKVVVSGIVDPKDNAKSQNLRVSVSRRGGLSEKNVDEATKLILDLGLEVTAVSTKKPGALRDKLNILQKYTVHRKKDEQNEHKRLLDDKQMLLRQVEEWQENHKGYLGIGIVKEILKEKGGLNEKLDELKKDSNDTARLRRQVSELRALIKLLPENLREPRELRQISSKIKNFIEASRAASVVPSKETTQTKKQEIQRLRDENDEYLQKIYARVGEIGEFIKYLDDKGQGKKVSESIRKFVGALKDDVEGFSDENSNTIDLQILKALNKEVIAIAIVMPEVPKDEKGAIKGSFSEGEIKQLLKDVKDFPRKIVRFIEQNAKSDGPSKVRLPSWSGVKEKVSEKLPGLAGALAKLSKKKESDLSKETKKGSDTGLRDSGMKK